MHRSLLLGLGSGGRYLFGVGSGCRFLLSLASDGRSLLGFGGSAWVVQLVGLVMDCSGGWAQVIWLIGKVMEERQKGIINSNQSTVEHSVKTNCC